MSTTTVTAVSPATIWANTLVELELQMTRATFQQWLKDATLHHIEDGAFVIQVRSAYAQDWLNNRLRETIERTLSAIVGQQTAVRFVVEGAAEQPNGHIPPPPEDPDPRPERPTDGYGGHLNDEERQQLLNKIQARENQNGHHASAANVARASQEGKRGPKHKVPRPPKKNKNGRGDQASIDVVERDPMKAHVETPHYAKRFWQPILGVNAFALWELLRSYYYFVKYHNAEQPTISLLCETLGWNDRRTLLGREATSKSKGYLGAAQVLEQHGILKHTTEGKGPQTTHLFKRVLDDLPLLTPKQVATLPKAKQIEHETFLSYYEFDIDAWLAVTDETHVQETAAKRVL